MALMNSIGLHWAFIMKIHELGTKGYLKSLADKMLNGVLKQSNSALILQSFI